MSRSRALAHKFVTIGFAAVVVMSPLPFNMAAICLWGVLFVGWAGRNAELSGPRAARGESMIQGLVMGLIVLGAAVAPWKVVDEFKARRGVLPRASLTLADLKAPFDFGLEIPSPFRSSVEVPDDLAARVVHFPSRELSVGSFIAAIEAQTPLRHAFRHCGNGYTILRGGDCSFGLGFRVPRDRRPPR